MYTTAIGSRNSYHSHCVDSGHERRHTERAAFPALGAVDYKLLRVVAKSPVSQTQSPTCYLSTHTHARENTGYGTEVGRSEP